MNEKYDESKHPRDDAGRFANKEHDWPPGGTNALGTPNPPMDIDETVAALNAADYGVAGDPGHARDGYAEEEQRDYEIGYFGQGHGLERKPGYSHALLCGFDDAEAGEPFGASWDDSNDDDEDPDYKMFLRDERIARPQDEDSYEGQEYRAFLRDQAAELEDLGTCARCGSDLDNIAAIKTGQAYCTDCALDLGLVDAGADEDESALSEKVHLLTVPAGTSIEYDFPGAPHMIRGRVAQQVGMSELGNSGFRIEGCDCGEEHNISRTAKVTVLHDEHAKSAEEFLEQWNNEVMAQFAPDGPEALSPEERWDVAGRLMTAWSSEEAGERIYRAATEPDSWEAATDAVLDVYTDSEDRINGFKIIASKFKVDLKEVYERWDSRA